MPCISNCIPLSKYRPSQRGPLVSIWDDVISPTPVRGTPGQGTTSRGCVSAIATCVWHCNGKPRKAPGVPDGVAVSFWHGCRGVSNGFSSTLTMSLVRLYYSVVYLCHIESICYVGPMDSGSTCAWEKCGCDLAFLSALSPVMLFTGIAHTKQIGEYSDIKRLIWEAQMIQSN